VLAANARTLAGPGFKLGIWNRLFSGISSPEAGGLTLVGDEPHFEGDVNGVRVWRFADGDAVGIYFGSHRGLVGRFG